MNSQSHGDAACQIFSLCDSGLDWGGTLTWVFAWMAAFALLLLCLVIFDLWRNLK